MAAGWNKGTTKEYKCKFCGEDDPDKFYVKLRLKGTCKKCHTANSHQKKRETKHRAIEYLGGGCKHCGYNKCTSALEFHHVDPGEKEFGWGDKPTSKWDAIKEELDKCILLCSNCHKEEHDRIWFDSLVGYHPEKSRREKL